MKETIASTILASHLKVAFKWSWLFHMFYPKYKLSASVWLAPLFDCNVIQLFSSTLYCPLDILGSYVQKEF